MGTIGFGVDGSTHRLSLGRVGPPKASGERTTGQLDVRRRAVPHLLIDGNPDARIDPLGTFRRLSEATGFNFGVPAVPFVASEHFVVDVSGVIREVVVGLRAEVVAGELVVLRTGSEVEEPHLVLDVPNGFAVALRRTA